MIGIFGMNSPISARAGTIHPLGTFIVIRTCEPEAPLLWRCCLAWGAIIWSPIIETAVTSTEIESAWSRSLDLGGEDLPIFAFGYVT